MIRKLIACLLITIVLGCTNDIEYKWDTRYITTGRLTDANGQPLHNINVSIYISTNSGIPGPWGTARGDDQIISETLTGNNGEYTLMFPKPENANQIQLLINTAKDGSVINPLYSQTINYNLESNNFIDYKFDAGMQQLFTINDATTLTVTLIDNPSIPLRIGGINFNGLIDPNYIDMNFDTSMISPAYSSTDVLKVAKNQTVYFKYQRLVYHNDDTVTIIPSQLPIAIGNEPVNFVFEY